MIASKNITTFIFTCKTNFSIGKPSIIFKMTVTLRLEDLQCRIFSFEYPMQYHG